MRSSGLVVALVGAALALGLLTIGWALRLGSSEARAVVGLEPTPTPTPTATLGATSDSEWSLVVDGLIRSPLNVTFDDLVAMPRSTVYAKLYCVGLPSTPLAEGYWTGVRLGLLLEEAGVAPEAIKVAFYANDGFTTDLTVGTAAREDIILAYEEDGESLPEKVRLVVPGKWGYKWIKGPTHIELVDYDYLGRYETLGYSDEANLPGGPVGGIAELPPVAGTDGSSINDYAITAALALVMFVAFATVGWYVRRRWLA